jgi:hypothetical protein
MMRIESFWKEFPWFQEPWAVGSRAKNMPGPLAAISPLWIRVF